ncbi:hypothetical protein NDU88_001924 [Pleurodeles waltl]|uniref:Uncharacterized protein n=1 Tax=Pleurodeles waltl TaxID=8319 RepID=A0AAV7LE73_PLEWA|nr:hypothetical protein NDU88_001924 [Pleurodeles waltl]
MFAKLKPPSGCHPLLELYSCGFRQFVPRTHTWEEEVWEETVWRERKKGEENSKKDWHWDRVKEKPSNFFCKDQLVEGERNREEAATREQWEMIQKDDKHLQPDANYKGLTLGQGGLDETIVAHG